MIISGLMNSVYKKMREIILCESVRPLFTFPKNFFKHFLKTK